MKKVNYINNKSLYTAMVEHRTRLEEAIRLNKPKPTASNYVGESILKICSKLGTKGNFSGYSFNKEMVSDGIIDCVAAIDNFDPDKTNNPFAYFTQIAWNAFIRRIEKEAKQNYIKHKNFQTMVLSNTYGETYYNEDIKTNEASDEVIKNFENKLIKAKKQAVAKGLEKFANTEMSDELV